ncbi:hypothetical protein K466DRAFT_654091 [Polyporus arcularius HHB13444]|uniref:Uncharacterized protein n=1 Tax=Polyporus arcularius HHB13444 TaxID=1314778 RepID=A0A5C3P9Y7_9APHY|nr:hypothetical protein K466DRAFT_654091 [Polyporus arcularius HHB13444]
MLVRRANCAQRPQSSGKTQDPDAMRQTAEPSIARSSLRFTKTRVSSMRAVLVLTILVAHPSYMGAVAQGTNGPLAFIHPRPSLTLCAPNTFLWTGGTPPFTLEIRLPSGQVSVLAELPFTNISARHFTWTPDFEGTNVLAMLFDSSNATTTSAPFSIQSTGNTTCSRANSAQKDTAPVIMVDTGATSTNAPHPGVFVGVVIAAAIVMAGILALFYWLCIAQRNRRGFKRVEIDDWELLSEPDSPSDTGKKGVVHHGDGGVPTIVVTSPSIAPSILSHEQKNGHRGRGDTPPAMREVPPESDEEEDVPLFQLASARSAGHVSTDVIFSADAHEGSKDERC